MIKNKKILIKKDNLDWTLASLREEMSQKEIADLINQRKILKQILSVNYINYKNLKQ